jgi:hypothetical protein
MEIGEEAIGDRNYPSRHWLSLCYWADLKFGHYTNEGVAGEIKEFGVWHVRNRKWKLEKGDRRSELSVETQAEACATRPI